MAEYTVAQLAGGPQRLNRQEISEVLRKEEIEYAADMEPDLVLSARTPWVEGRGHLEFDSWHGHWYYYGDCLAAWSVSPANAGPAEQHKGDMRAWLWGLTKRSRYLVALDVDGGYAAYPDSGFEISFNFHPSVLVRTPLQVILLVLETGEDDRNIMDVRPSYLHGWTFYSMEVSKLG